MLLQVVAVHVTHLWFLALNVPSHLPDVVADERGTLGGVAFDDAIIGQLLLGEGLSD